MKPKTAIITIAVMAFATVIVSFTQNRVWEGFAAFLASGFSMLTLIGGFRVWKPWFMNEVEDMPDTPSMTPHVVIAALMEGIVIAAFLLNVGWAWTAFRAVGLAIQLALSGKMSKDIK